jgi:hypothetical protein
MKQKRVSGENIIQKKEKLYMQKKTTAENARTK